MGASVSTRLPDTAAQEFQQKLVYRLSSQSVKTVLPLLTTTYVTEQVLPKVVQWFESLNTMFPRDAFYEYRNWSSAAPPFKLFFDKLPNHLTDLNVFFTYAKTHKLEVSSVVGVSQLAQLEANFDIVKRHVRNGLLAAMYSMVQKFEVLNMAWLHFLDRGKVLAGFKEAATLVPIQVTGWRSSALTLTRMTKAGLRMITVLNYFVRKWTELTVSEQYVNWIDALTSTARRKARAINKARATTAFKNMLNERIQFARANQLMMSTALIIKYSNDLDASQQQWEHYLAERHLDQVPCLVVVATHGMMKPETDSAFTVRVPENTSVTRVVTTPPGYMNVLHRQEFDNVARKLLNLVDEIDRDVFMDPAAKRKMLNVQRVIEALRFSSTSQASERNVFNLSVAANISNAFGKRYLPGESYLNKDYSVTVEEYLNTVSANSWSYFDSIIVAVKGKLINIMKDMHAQNPSRNPEEEMQISLDSVIAMAQTHLNPGEALDAVVVDLSCNSFYSEPFTPAVQAQDAYTRAAITGSLGYESDEEFKRRSRQMRDRGLHGGLCW